MPIGDRGAGKSDFVGFGCFENGVQSHVSTVAPTPDAEAIGIHIRLKTKPRCAIALIGEFLSSEAKVDGLFKKMAATRGAAIIQGKNNKTLLGHQLMPKIV